MLHRHHYDSSRRNRYHAGHGGDHEGEHAKKVVLDLAKRRLARTARKADLVGSWDVQQATLVVLRSLHVVIHILKILVNGQAMSFVANIGRSKGLVSLQTMGCFQLREAEKTGRLYPLRRAEQRCVMIRLVVSLRWAPDGADVVSSTF